jgi:pimeloyl-ACP methyl ester carboxylesterase
MRAKHPFLLVLLLAIFAFPACGQMQPPAAPPDKTISIFGQTIHYWDVGTGPAVVLMHGLGSSREHDWIYAIGPLAEKYHVLAMDQIGFGESEKPLIDYSIQTYVDFLNEFLRQMKVEKADLVGESLGGWIVALYAAEQSSSREMVPVEKLVLVDAAGLPQTQALPPLNPSSLEQTRKLMQAVFYDTSWLDEAALRRIFSSILATNDGYTIHSLLSNPALKSEMMTDKMGEIHVPTLVLWGKQDALLPLASGERYAAGIAGAQLISFDKCGHVPPVEKAAEFVGAVEKFLDGTPTARKHAGSTGPASGRTARKPARQMR